MIKPQLGADIFLRSYSVILDFLALWQCLKSSVDSTYVSHARGMLGDPGWNSLFIIIKRTSLELGFDGIKSMYASWHTTVKWGNKFSFCLVYVILYSSFLLA
jgi:hypothetical protein